MKIQNNRAFTLVELAIVIVIIGLLVGGVLAGQELVKQAKIQNVIKNVESYKAATITYKGKYGDVPGDSNKHAQFFPGSGITEGNGNGQIDQHPEVFEYWRALTLANLVKGSYPGYESTSYIRSGSMPKDGAGFNYVYKCTPALTGSFSTFMKNSCWYYVTIFNSALTVSNSGYGAFSVQDMKAIDLKYDDGLPSSGKILAMRTAANNNPNVCTVINASTAVSSSPYVDTNDDSLDCQPMFEFLP